MIDITGYIHLTQFFKTSVISAQLKKAKNCSYYFSMSCPCYQLPLLNLNIIFTYLSHVTFKLPANKLSPEIRAEYMAISELYTLG